MATLNRTKFAADLLDLSADLRTVLAKARDLNKRFNEFSNEVNALASSTTAWDTTVFDKDHALDGMSMVQQFLLWATNGTPVTRDNENTMARLENLQG